MELNYHQRKVLRRIARGQTVQNRMYFDPVLTPLIAYDPPPPPVNPNVLEWVDWEVELRNSRAVLTELGKQALAELDTK